MSYRSVWTGFLKLALITCPVKLYAATAELEKQKFTQINKDTGNKVNFLRQDAVTGEVVPYENLMKGIEVVAGRYEKVTDEELEAAAPRSAAVIEIEELVPASGISWLYPDALYYLGPDGLAAAEAFALLREGIARSRMAALGQLSLGTREHLVMMLPGRKVIKLSTLRYAPEVRSEDMCFPKLVDVAAPADLIEPVGKILEARRHDAFNAERFRDRYAAAIADLVKAKISGTMVRRTALPPPRLIDLAKAVKRSAATSRRLDGPRGKRKSRAA